MEEENLNQLLVTDPASIFYLTGKWIYPGERMLALYINRKGNHKLFINELFPLEEDLGVEKVSYNDRQDPIEVLTSFIDKDSAIGIDKSWPSRFLIDLMEQGSASRYVNGSFIIDDLRMIKDKEEITFLREASRLNDQAMEKLIGEISEPYSEQDLNKKLREIYRKIGGDDVSFEPIIGFGANAADPHHVCDNTKLREGDSIVIDIGCFKNNYCSDMTRTVFYKSVSEKAKEIYRIVQEANEKTKDFVKPGARFCDVDHVARKIIEDTGYGKYFNHRTGHSIGIEIHEPGDVSEVNTNLLKPGMVFSIEPGIYLPGEVGVRIEDLVVVTENGCEVLNHYDRNLQVVKS